MEIPFKTFEGLALVSLFSTVAFLVVTGHFAMKRVRLLQRKPYPTWFQNKLQEQKEFVIRVFQKSKNTYIWFTLTIALSHIVMFAIVRSQLVATSSYAEIESFMEYYSEAEWYLFTAGGMVLASLFFCWQLDEGLRKLQVT